MKAIVPRPGPARPRELLDTLHRVETPEGIELVLHPAGPAPRALAWVIDSLIRLAILWLGAVVLGALGRFGLGMFLVLWFVVWWLYPVLFEVLRGGATPGKRAVGIYVAHADGTPVGWSASLVRNLLRVVDFLPLLYGLGLATLLLSPRFQRLGDLAAGTLVLYRRDRRARAAPPEQRPLPPGLPLTLDESQAVISYAERVHLLTPERARELAGLAAPLAGPDEASRVERLLGTARWLAGERP